MIGRRERLELGSGRIAHVALPEGYDTTDSSYPLLLCLDPQWIFGTLCDASLNLGLARVLPRVVVVGVGWDATTAKEVLRRRGEAYTPTAAPFPDRVAPKEPDGQSAPSGGAPRHLDWLADHVLPLLERRYRLAPEGRMLVGHSLSALFGLYTLFNRPATFDRYLLASPSIWWDDRAILSEEERYAAGHGDLAAKVFVSVGSDEEPPGFFPMITNARLVVDRLRSRSYPGLDLHFTLLDGEIHQSTIPAAISRGLRVLAG